MAEPVEEREAGVAAGTRVAAGAGVGAGAGAEVLAGPEPPAGHKPPGEHGHRAVALLLGAVAIVAALVGARATSLASDATDAWHSALRTEVKRATAAVEDIRYLYQSELPPTILVLGTRLQEAELRSAAAGSSGATQAALTMEAEIAAGVADATEGSYELATDPRYALDGAGVDLATRLADLRAAQPDLVALDPDTVGAQGDRLGAKAGSTTFALLPLGLAALLGAMAQPFSRARRLLLGGGTAALAIGAAVAVAVEVLA